MVKDRHDSKTCNVELSVGQCWLLGSLISIAIPDGQRHFRRFGIKSMGPFQESLAYLHCMVPSNKNQNASRNCPPKRLESNHSNDVTTSGLPHTARPYPYASACEYEKTTYNLTSY